MIGTGRGLVQRGIRETDSTEDNSKDNLTKQERAIDLQPATARRTIYPQARILGLGVGQSSTMGR